MAKSVLRFVKFTIWIFSLIYLCETTTNYPQIDSVLILNQTVINRNNNLIENNYILQINGINLTQNIWLVPTVVNGNYGTKCEYFENDLNNFSVNIFDSNHNNVVYVNVSVIQYNSLYKPIIYFCVGKTNFKNIFVKQTRRDSEMIHLGENVSILFRTKPTTEFVNNNIDLNLTNNRIQRSINDKNSLNIEDDSVKLMEPVEDSSNDHSSSILPNYQPFLSPADIHKLTKSVHTVTHLIGFRIWKAYKDPETDEDNVPILRANTNNTLNIFGSRITENTLIAFTLERSDRNELCHMPITNTFRVYDVVREGSAFVDVNIPTSHGDNIYFCTKEAPPWNATADEIKLYNNLPLIHQGDKIGLVLRTNDRLLPLWVQILIIICCLCFSSLFSGLNLGLMSLDRTELKILINTGTESERKYAGKIKPVRDHGNFLLCSILLGNVLVNSTFTILLDDLTSGVIAVACATLLIVIFGEITPQAICSRHGLWVGAKTIFITKAIMVITSPLAYPISKLLDWILGEEIGNVYNRERLKELVKVTTDTNDLDKDEVNIISGALELRKKTVSDVMTRIEDVFMLDYDAILNFETVSEIMKSGFSRIPVYEGTRTNIVTMLYIKDLAFVDPDDNTPLKTLCQFYQNPCNFVFEDVTLDVMFRQFKEGHKGHMAFVHRVNNEGEGDPFYETIGLVTLEDVIEELIQAEIMDETDVFTDNRSKRRRNEHRKQDFTIFAERRENQRIRISPQLTLATFQYMSTSIDLFLPANISETILRRMLKQDIITHIKKNKKDKHDPATIIYQQGKPADYFVLILEGRVEVTVGRENLIFESGPFTYFGKQALMQNIGGVESPVQPNITTSAMGSLQSVNMDAILRHTFVPDYSVRAITEVLYIKIKRSLYMAAKRATLMERSQKDTTVSSPGDQFDDEVEKLLHSLEEDGTSTGRGSPINSEINVYVKEANRKQSITQLQTSPSMKGKLSPASFISYHQPVQMNEINGSIKKPNSIAVINTSIGDSNNIIQSPISNRTGSLPDDGSDNNNKEEEIALLSTNIRASGDKS